MPMAPDAFRKARIRFPTKDQVVLSDELLELVAEVYRRQRDDDARFRTGVRDLISRLDLTPGVIVGVNANHRFARLVENWVVGCDRFGIEVRSRTLVFATDDDAAARLRARGLVVYFDQESESLSVLSESQQYGDDPYVGYLFHQNWVIRTLLGLDVDVLFQDADVVWRRDPIPLLRDRAEIGVDLQAMYDGPNPRFQPLYANSGFMYLRGSPHVRQFWDEVYARHDMVRYFASQQRPFNVMLGYHALHGLEVEILDEERFANGHLFTKNYPTPPDPWVVHHSWTLDLETKLERYDANGHWYLDSTL